MENKYRKDFPFFKAIDENQAGDNKNLIYFDTAATAQRPFIVLNAMTHFYATENANPLRGLYSLSERATMAYENARKTVAQFINAKETNEIVFTRNASESFRTRFFFTLMLTELIRQWQKSFFQKQRLQALRLRFQARKFKKKSVTT